MMMMMTMTMIGNINTVLFILSVNKLILQAANRRGRAQVTQVSRKIVL